MVLTTALAALIFTGAIFGFFYAWVCSTLWGLDQIEPQTAIEAMNAMNASVRNAVFFPIFFLTPIIALLAAGTSYIYDGKTAAALFFAAAVVYIVGAFVPTATINVPMNEALAVVSMPSDMEQARSIWSAYSQKWQFWNAVRTVASGISLLLVGLALTRLPAV